MRSPPTGTVTFLFTDIEGSTKLWERSPQPMQRALARHDELLGRVTEEQHGYVFKTVGDAFCCAFRTATAALEAALETQRRLLSSEWGETGPLRVRMALHTGAAEERDGDYFGPPLNRVARLLSAAHGSQVLLSLPTEELVRDQLPGGTSLRDLGEYRLKDLFRPERVFQLLTPELPSEFPPLRTLDAYRNNLPLQPTPLIGREKEVSEVCDLLRGEETRLLTLTGPGGIGKSRLALQAAADLLDDFSDGTFLVPLATLSEAELLLPAVAETLGVRETGEQPLDESLKDYLSERRLLLLLDNFEQVLEAAPAVTELLAGAPGLKVVATSRAPLRLYGEHEFPVPPLSLPDLKRPPPLERLTQYEAVGLFVERARALKPDFSITNESAPAVAEICVRLDGLPLAIELAAARIKMLPPRAMLQRLGSRLKLLTGGARDLPERQRTLRATIEWSHALLDEGEQLLFGRLAVFSGGRTLEAIEAICDAQGDLPVDAFEGVSSLLDKSLLRQEEGPNGEPRFVMLETVHEYARERLHESGEAEEIKRAHAEYFLALAEEAKPKQHGLEEQAWLYRLEAEHDNMRAALSWSLGGGDVVVGLRLAGALGWFWYVRGHFSEGRGWLEEGLTKVGDEAPADARARALVELGNLATEQGDFERAKDSSKEAIALHRELGDKKGLAYSLGILGWATMFQGDDERATALLEESLAVARESGVEWTIDYALNALSVMAGDRGDFGQAEAFWEEALVHARKRGDRRRVIAVLYNMGFAEAVRGDYERATALLEESLAIGRESRDTYSVAISLMSLGLASTRRGDHGRARMLLGESLVLSSELGLKVNVAECLEILSGMAGELEDIPRAARLWGVADALREAIGAPWLPLERRVYEPYLTAIRTRADEAVWTKAWEEGQAMPLEEAIAYALEEEDRG